MPQVFIGFFAKIGITGAIGTILGYVAYTVVTVALLRALRPKANMSQMRGLMANTRGATDPQNYVYGTVRKGGTITYLESTGTTNEYLHMIIVLAGHEVNAIGDIYINDEVATLDGSGFVTSGNWNSKIRVKKHLGTAAQTADADLLAESAQITSDFRGRGIAYLYVRLQYDQDVFANGIPLFSAVVQGKKVFDPRSSTTAYSANAALCIRDYLVDARGLGDSAIDNTSFSAAANVCDENVSLSGGGSEKRYTINGVISADQSIQDALQQMVTACGGSLWWGGGSWKLKPGYYTAPVKTLTLDDIVSEISTQTRVPMRDNFNIVRGTFNDAGQRWIAAEYPELRSAAFISEDDGVESPIDMEFPLTTSAATVQRLAKQLLFRNREQITFTADFGMAALELQVGDIVALTIDRYGWSAKEFEIVAWTFGANGEAGDLRVTMTLRETSSAAFSWTAEEAAIIANNTNLPNPFGGLTISSLTATGAGRTQGDGTFINTVIVDWADVSNKFLDYYEVEWKATSDATYAATTVDESSIELSPLVDGVQYTIRVRAVTVAGVKGAFTAVTHTPGGDTTAPGIPTSVSATGGFRQVLVQWTPPADADYKEAQVFVNSSNTTVGATAIGLAGGTEFMHGGLSAGVTNWYFVKARDFSGNTSGFSTGASATTLSDPADGTDGKSVYTAIVFKRSATAPATPSGGSFNFGTNTLTPPSGWYLDVPAGTDPIYGTRYVFSIIGDTGTDSAGTWSTPFEIAENGVDGLDGADGADGLSTFAASIFQRAATAPATPTGGSYNFGTNTLTPPSGWSATVPSGTNPLYTSSTIASVQGVTGIDSTLTWSTPVILAQNGADGTAGDNGDTIITGRVYYQTLQASAPATPSASSYNTSTATFVGLTAGWSLSQPSVDITDTTVKEWSSAFQVTIDGATSAQTLYFSTPTGAIQVTADIESDNYVAGTSGWKIERDTGNAEFQNATIRGTLNASDITAGTIAVARLPGLTELSSTSSSGFTVSTGGTVSQTFTVSASGVTSGAKAIFLVDLYAYGPGGSNDTSSATFTTSTSGFSATANTWTGRSVSSVVSGNVDLPSTYEHYAFVGSGTATSSSVSATFTVTGTNSRNYNVGRLAFVMLLVEV